MKRIVYAPGKLKWEKSALTAFMLSATMAIALPAQTLTALHNFNGTDGKDPVAGLVQATDGDFYGTTNQGGRYSSGTIFKITPSGTLTTLYNFCSESNCTDGYFPQAGLVQATNGNFYGTTYAGGADVNGVGGTVFKITPSGRLTTLYSFCVQDGCSDGYGPEAGLVQANDDYYGTASAGGAHDGGTVFKITPSGTLTTLYSFCSQSNCTDGDHPYAGLVQSTNGDFYGTTHDGGAYGYGTVFKITPHATLTTLYSFCFQLQSGCPDGDHPFAGLVQAASGNFYGTTESGGANGGGTVFKITPSGTLTTLHSFCSENACLDGENSYAGLIQATNGNLYGTTDAGGTSGYGVIFEITPGGTLTTVDSFCAYSGCSGEYPVAGLVQATNGEFYGTTSYGGATGTGGTVFSLSVGLGPFVKTQPTSGKVGAAVKILGTNLTGATGVSFNSIAAVFQVISSSEITTTVPAGATTGKVQVVTPSGTLLSNVSFRVPGGGQESGAAAPPAK